MEICMGHSASTADYVPFQNDYTYSNLSPTFLYLYIRLTNIYNIYIYPKKYIYISENISENKHIYIQKM